MAVKKALIVDDSRLAQFVLKKMLTTKNMVVDLSETAEEALRYLESHTPDVIFLDHSMPGMNGLEALKIIKANSDTASIPVLMYTSQDDQSYIVKARELGALEVLPKQLKTSELDRALNLIQSANDDDSKEEDFFVDNAPLEFLMQEADDMLERVDKPIVVQQTAVKEQLLEQRLSYMEQRITALEADDMGATKESYKLTHKTWAMMYVATLLLFAFIYWQSRSQIEPVVSLSTPSSFSSDQPVVRQTDQNRTDVDLSPVASDKVSAEFFQPVVLSLIEDRLNQNNEIPFGEDLLGNIVLENLRDLIDTLNEVKFTGRVMVVAHDGRFCVKNGDNNQLVLPADNTTVSECQIVEPSTELSDLASIDMLQLISDINQDNSISYNFVVTTRGTEEPLQNYPPIADTTLAGLWNEAALKNRRVQIRLEEILR